MKLDIPVEIRSAEVMQKTVRSKEGKEFLIRDQVGWADLGKAYPQEIRIPLESGSDPYRPGKYVVHGSCLYVDRYKNLSLGRLKLIPAT